MEFERMLKYLSGLEMNNRREWFHQTHKEYEAAKKDFEELTELLKVKAFEAAPDMGQDVLLVPVKKMIYRVARDMRYARDGVPYKPRFSTYISDCGKDSDTIGFFVTIRPGGSYIGTGIYGTSDNLSRIRGYILSHAEEWEELMADEYISTHLSGNKLKRVPTGYSADSKAAEWLKYKSFWLVEEIDNKTLTSFSDFADRAGEIFSRMEPLRAFLNNTRFYND